MGAQSPGIQMSTYPRSFQTTLFSLRSILSLSAAVSRDSLHLTTKKAPILCHCTQLGVSASKHSHTHKKIQYEAHLEIQAVLNASIEDTLQKWIMIQESILMCFISILACSIFVVFQRKSFLNRKNVFAGLFQSAMYYTKGQSDTNRPHPDLEWRTDVWFYAGISMINHCFSFLHRMNSVLVSLQALLKT